MYRGHPRVPGRADGHRRGADRHGRPLARAGVDHGDAGRQGRLQREAVVHDHRRRRRRWWRPRGSYGRVYQTGTQRLSEANLVFAIEMARTRPAGQGPHGLRAHRAVGCGRDAATTGCRPSRSRPRTRWTGTSGWARARGGRSTRRTSAAAGAAITTSTPVASASGARTRSRRPRPGLDVRDTSPVEYEYVDNDTGDGMVTHVRQRREDDPVARRQVLARLVRRAVRRRARAGSRAADGYSQPDVSSPALLADFKKVVGDYVARTGRSLNHMRNFLDCVQVAQADRGQSRGHAPLDDHRARRQHLHVAQAESEVRPGQGGIRRRRRGQPAACAGHARAVRLLVDRTAGFAPCLLHQREIPTMWKHHQYLILTVTLLSAIAARALGDEAELLGVLRSEATLEEKATACRELRPGGHQGSGAHAGCPPG